MTDEGMCCGGQMAVHMPYLGANANAQKLWGLEADEKYAQGVVYAPRGDNVAFRSFGNAGGLNPEINPQPFYDPRTITMRSPIDTIPGELIGGTPSLRHGPCVFDYTPADVLPRTQYAPQGDLMAEPIAMDISRQPCICACVLAYSMTSLMLLPKNVVAVRTALINAGLATATPALLAQSPNNTCGCRLMGGVEANIYGPFANFCQQYTEISIIQILEPAKQVAFFNQVYVARVIESARAMVTASAQMNYARAEGPRAQLQSYPVVDCTPSTFSATLPPILPGTGVNVVETDTLYATRALTDPRSAVSCKAALSCLTGLPIGTRPHEVTECEIAEKMFQTVQNIKNIEFESAFYSPVTIVQPFQL
jgi:hypothetical protein